MTHREKSRNSLNRWCFPRPKRRLVSVLGLFTGVLTAPGGAFANDEPQPPLAAANSPAASSPAASSPAANSPAAVNPQRSPADDGGVTKFAVVVGNNQSLGKRRPELHYADDDAARYFEILDTLAPGRVTLLSHLDRDTERLFPTVVSKAQAPTRAALDALGRSLAEQIKTANAAGKRTELYFVFAGHGDVDHGEGFIELADGRFHSHELEAWLRAIPFTRAHVILDSCNSFFMLGVRKPGGRHFATSEDAAQTLAKRLPNVGVFLSTSAEGEAFEWSEIQSGIFSHVVRSGLLGAADANVDGSVSYLELAAFVDTATQEVRNPNMRPHVYARGPGAADDAPILRLSEMKHVRAFDLDDQRTLKFRIRDANGLPLLDAHTELARKVKFVLPVAWATGAVLDRSIAGNNAASPLTHQHYSVPESTEPVTLAHLSAVDGATNTRGPAETFQWLFARPFGPTALASYRAQQRSAPRMVYGVSHDDLERMKLVLANIAATDRARRLSDSIGSTGFGLLLGFAGIRTLTGSERDGWDTVTGATLTGLGAAAAIGGTVTLFVPGIGEEAQAAFHEELRSGGDPARAFAAADERLEELVEKLERERTEGVIFGCLVFVGTSAGFIYNSVRLADCNGCADNRTAWAAGMFGGGLMFADSLLSEQPAETLSRIWRQDPGLNRYQPKLNVHTSGLGLSLSGRF